MKKIISIAITLAILAMTAVSLVTASYATTSAGTLSVSDAAVDAGELVTVPVTLSGNTGVWSAKVYVYFDPALEATELVNGNVFQSGELTKSNDLNIPASSIAYVAASFRDEGLNPANFNCACAYYTCNADEGTNADGTLFTITFRAPSAPGTYTVGVFTPDDGDTIDANDNDRVFTSAAATVTVNAAAPAVNLGDVNGDGKINSRDTALFKRYFADPVGTSGVVIANCDLNGDGKINSRDMASLKRCLAGGTV